MVINDRIAIEVAYAKPDRQVILTLQVMRSCTIAEAIEQSGILHHFPEIDLTQQSVGIFSQPRALSDAVQQDDRIEIYRPMLQDPKETRRLKAKGSFPGRG